MCNDCCKEFKGWCRSFTRLEACLSLLQLVFLIVLIAALVFIILHFLACLRDKDKILEQSTHNIITSSETEGPVSTSVQQKGSTCTWDPSRKTKALTHYYEIIQTVSSTQPTKAIVLHGNDEWDGDIVNENVEFLIGLVKYKPPQHMTFGCTLTIISTKWTLTAATCIEAIEELDTLDSFVIMEGLGTGNPGRFHAISDVMIHPQYDGGNRNYDLTAIKSEDDIVSRDAKLVTLPALVDVMSITIGEKMQLYGFGKFRSVDNDPITRKVRRIKVHKLPVKHCPAGNSTWSPRHLVGGEALAQGSCGKTSICASVLKNLKTPCNYCAGAPLLYRGVLLGVMSDNPQCGISCDPVLYVNIAAVRDWIDSVVNNY